MRTLEIREKLWESERVRGKRLNFWIFLQNGFEHHKHITLLSASCGWLVVGFSQQLSLPLSLFWSNPSFRRDETFLFFSIYFLVPWYRRLSAISFSKNFRYLFKSCFSPSAVLLLQFVKILHLQAKSCPRNDSFSSPSLSRFLAFVVRNRTDTIMMKRLDYHESIDIRLFTRRDNIWVQKLTRFLAKMLSIQCQRLPIDNLICELICDG